MIDSKEELDNIFGLLSLSVVFGDFQKTIDEESRGLNIGCVIVNKDNGVVYHGLNSITSERNFSQHGEVRAMLGYLSQIKPNNYGLQGHTLYTTLEPCAMCSGMMVHTELDRTVSALRELPFKGSECLEMSYGQTLQRLAKNVEGLGPYPLSTQSDFLQHPIADEFLSASIKFQKNDEGQHHVGAFLASEKARELFSKAEELFINFKPTHKDNFALYQNAYNYYSNLPDYGDPDPQNSKIVEGYGGILYSQPNC